MATNTSMNVLVVDDRGTTLRIIRSLLEQVDSENAETLRGQEVVGNV